MAADSANIECVFSSMNVQRTKEQNKLDMTIVEAILQWKWNIHIP